MMAWGYSFNWNDQQLHLSDATCSYTGTAQPDLVVTDEFIRGLFENVVSFSTLIQSKNEHDAELLEISASNAIGTSGIQPFCQFNNQQTWPSG